jgi:polysaccharide export outer membrane protein
MLKPDGSSSFSCIKGYFMALMVLALFSCGNTTKLTYFNDSTEERIAAANGNPEPVFRPNDLLSITVTSLNQEATAVFNAPNESTPQTSSATAGGNTLTVGYLIDQNGQITYPILGKIQAEGLTKTQLTDFLVKELTDRKLLVDPIVTIRHLNFRISVMGEVVRPGVYTIQNEKISILEGLSLAGDITIYGRRDNVLVIREDVKGNKTLKRLNLNSKEVLKSPYYFLESDDIVYVEPSKDRVTKERNQMLVPVFISLATLMIVIVDRIGF